MLANMLPGQNGATCRHAYRAFVARLGIADAIFCKCVDHRRPGEGSAIAAQPVIALLVGGYEEDFPAHNSLFFELVLLQLCRRSRISTLTFTEINIAPALPEFGQRRIVERVQTHLAGDLVRRMRGKRRE